MPNSLSKFTKNIPYHFTNFINRLSCCRSIINKQPTLTNLSDKTHYQIRFQSVTDNIHFYGSYPLNDPIFVTEIYHNATYYAKTKYISFTGQLWSFHLDLKSFEVFHGISRVCKLISDRLTDSIIINQELLKNPEDNGEFHITQLIGLITTFQKLETRSGLLALSIPSLESTFSDPPGHHFNSHKNRPEISLPSVISQLKALLVAFRQNLYTRDLALLRFNCNFINAFALGILACFSYYENRLHPLLLLKKRNLISSKFATQKNAINALINQQTGASKK
jgi:hypothetical protein